MDLPNAVFADAEPLFDVFDYFAVAQLEGVDLYAASESSVRFANVNMPEGGAFRIPPISHHIWLVNRVAPQEVRESDIQTFEAILTVLDGEGTAWDHRLWTNCKACIPQTTEHLAQRGVKVYELSKNERSLGSFETLESLIYEKQFGVAADYTRLLLLKEFGGFYTDLNYIFAHSPEVQMKTYDFMAHTDRGGFFVDVYMIASIPQHPVIIDALKRVQARFDTPPSWILQAQNSTLDIRDYTGLMTYLPFNWACFTHLNKGTQDFIFPLETKEPYPVEAKQAYFEDVEDQEPYAQYGTCGVSSAEKTGEEVMKRYAGGDICMTEILGFDSRDGDTWHDEEAYDD